MLAPISPKFRYIFWEGEESKEGRKKQREGLRGRRKEEVGRAGKRGRREERG